MTAARPLLSAISRNAACRPHSCPSEKGAAKAFETIWTAAPRSIPTPRQPVPQVKHRGSIDSRGFEQPSSKQERSVSWIRASAEMSARPARPLEKQDCAEALAESAKCKVYHLGISVQPSISCRIHLLRHGETQWNVKKILQGHTDIPLNKQGEEQACILANQLADVPFTAAVSSDLSRAHRTAQIVLGLRNVKIQTTKNLRERCLGSWEGRKISDLPPLALNLSKEEFLNFKLEPAMETALEVYGRIVPEIQKIALQHSNQDVLVVSHGGVMRALLSCIHYDPKQRWHVSNCARMLLEINNNQTPIIIQKWGIMQQPNEKSSIPF